MVRSSCDDDDEKQERDDFDTAVLPLAEYYTAIVSPFMMRMSRHLLMTQNALFEATAMYGAEKLWRVPNTRAQRAPSLFEQRLEWDAFCHRHATRADFQRHIRMSKLSFDKLLLLIRHDLMVDAIKARCRGGAILPELCLYCCLRYCAGGSYSDIKYFIGISTSSFYRVVWRCIDAINRCSELSIDFPKTTDEVIRAAEGFTSISSQGCIWNCVAVIDGYHLQIRPPSKSEVRNVKSFFSGHYQTYGLNIQAACDHNCRFLFVGVAGPGVMGDRDAIKQIRLGSLIESLPGLSVIVHILPVSILFPYFVVKMRELLEMTISISLQANFEFESKWLLD